MAILTRTGAFSASVGSAAVKRAEEGQLGGSDLRIWTGDKIQSVCRTPLLLSRLKAWKSYATSGLPALSDMYSSEDEDALDDAMLLLQHDNDFIYVFQGAGSIRKYGRTFRGATLSRIQGTITAKMLNMYNSCIRFGAPSYSQFNTDFSENHVCWERLCLPLTSGEPDGARFVLTYSLPLDDKLEVLNAIFERSPIGMVAAAAELGEDKPLAAARITLINNRARDILKIGGSADALRTVQDLRQWIKDVAGWKQLTDIVPTETATRQTMRYEEISTGRKFLIMIDPIGRFVTFHIVES